MSHSASPIVSLHALKEVRMIENSDSATAYALVAKVAVAGASSAVVSQLQGKLTKVVRAVQLNARSQKGVQNCLLRRY